MYRRAAELARWLLCRNELPRQRLYVPPHLRGEWFADCGAFRAAAQEDCIVYQRHLVAADVAHVHIVGEEEAHMRLRGLGRSVGSPWISQRLQRLELPRSVEWRLLTAKSERLPQI